VDVKEVSRELGIRYVLEGSVRKAGDKVRINAQLIDATTGGHIWAERYDGQMEDIFSLQDKITKKIVAALAVRLTPGEKENIANKGTESIEAYDAYLKGWQHYLQGTPDALSSAINDFKKAIELDPAYSQAYAALALTYDRGSAGGKKFVEALRADYFSARVIARHYLNIAMKNPTALAYRVASRMDLRIRRHDEALQNAEKAIAIYPNDAEMQLNMAHVLTYSGRPKEAMNVIKKVMQFDPNRMADCLFLLGIAHFSNKKYEEALSAFKRVRKYTSTHWTEAWLAIVYAHLGREKEAKAEFEKYNERWLGAVEGDQSITKLDLQPEVYNNPFKEPETIKRFVEGLIKAGHPEPHRYYVAYKKNMLSGDEIRALVFGRTETSPIFAGGTWTIKFEKAGNAFWDGYGFKDKGKWWLEGNQLCLKWKILMGAGFTVYNDLYHNPTGTLEGNDQYLKVTDFGMLPISYVD
jgi:tetratricopeptide (TPR) repeat protein